MFTDLVVLLSFLCYIVGIVCKVIWILCEKYWKVQSAGMSKKLFCLHCTVKAVPWSTVKIAELSALLMLFVTSSLFFSEYSVLYTFYVFSVFYTFYVFSVFYTFYVFSVFYTFYVFSVFQSVYCATVLRARRSISIPQSENVVSHTAHVFPVFQSIYCVTSNISYHWPECRMLLKCFHLIRLSEDCCVVHF